MTYENLQAQARQQQDQYLRQRVLAFTQQLEVADQTMRTQTLIQRAQLYTQLGEYDKASADYQMAVDAFLEINAPDMKAA